jgi:hypothetical protein
VGRGAIFIIYSNITITMIFEIDVIPLIVCVDRNPRPSLLNPMHACTWGIWDYFLVKLYFLIVLYSLCHWPRSCFIVVSSILWSRGLRMT